MSKIMEKMTESGNRREEDLEIEEGFDGTSRFVRISGRREEVMCLASWLREKLRKKRKGEGNAR